MRLIIERMWRRSGKKEKTYAKKETHGKNVFSKEEGKKEHNTQVKGKDPRLENQRCN